MTNALSRRNPTRALVTAGTAAMAHYVGRVAFSDSGQRLLWNGAKYVYDTLWNKQWRNGKTQDVVRHPGAMPGAIAAPVGITRIIRGSKPKFRKGKGSVTVTHRELIGQFNTSSGIVVNSSVTGNIYRLNPNNSMVFPWLQALSSNFDQYKFDSLRLQYVPLCGTNTNGRVALFFDKDSTDTLPTDRVELANMAHLTETSPWAEANLNIPVDNIKRFTSDSATPDTKLVDLGQFGVATYGSTTTDAAGDVFIHYTVTFFEPQPSASLLTSMSVIGSTTLTAGPPVYAVIRTATDLAISFKSPGVYFLSVSLFCTTFTGTSLTTGTTVSTFSQSHNGANHYMGNHIITVSQINGGIVFSGTSLTNFNINSVRAKTSNFAHTA